MARQGQRWFTADEMRARRKELNITLDALARHVGCTRQLLSAFENGKSGLSNDKRLLIAQWLDLPAPDILPESEKNQLLYEMEQLKQQMRQLLEQIERHPVPGDS